MTSLDPKIRCETNVPWDHDDFAGGWLPCWSQGMDDLQDLMEAARNAETLDHARRIDAIAGAIMQWWQPLEASRKAMNAWADQILLKR